MGKATKTFARVVTGVATGGLSEVARAAGGGRVVDKVEQGFTPGLDKVAGVTQEPKPPVLSESDNIVEQAKNSAVSDTENPLERIRKRARTLLTGGLGVQENAPVQRKSLLGS